MAVIVPNNCNCPKCREILEQGFLWYRFGARKTLHIAWDVDEGDPISLGCACDQRSRPTGRAVLVTRSKIVEIMSDGTHMCRYSENIAQAWLKDLQAHRHCSLCENYYHVQWRETALGRMTLCDACDRYNGFAGGKKSNPWEHPLKEAPPSARTIRLPGDFGSTGPTFGMTAIKVDPNRKY